MRIRLMAILLAALAPLPLLAQPKNDAGAWYETSRLETTNDPNGTIRFDHGNGWGISLNHFWTSSISTELAFATTRSDGNVDFPDGTTLGLGHFDVKATTLAVQWHPMRHGRIDPYIGGGGARITADAVVSPELAASGVTAVRLDHKWSWCGNAGVGFNVTPNIAIAIDGKYVRYEPNSSAPGDVEPVPLKLNPLFVGVGVKFRF